MSTGPLYAVADFGTNTFHLLIGRWEDQRLIEVHRERHFVRVAAEGIQQIGEASMQRALKAAEAMGRSLLNFPSERSAAFGTAALRTASNGPALKQALESRLGIPIQVIDGLREAELISKGVLSAGLSPEERYLVMDIGGGSVEFILIEKAQAVYADSFRLGAQVLRNQFHLREPMLSPAENSPGLNQLEVLEQYLDQVLAPMLLRCAGEGLTLLGASGTFDVLGDLYGQTANSEVIRMISPELIRGLFQESLLMDSAQRLADPRIPEDRADMLVVAMALIVFVLERLSPKQVLACQYALKEGALYELAMLDKTSSARV